MRRFQTLNDFVAVTGEELGAGDWLVVTQERIDRFAEASGDDYWVHTDPVRAARHLPGGRTLAHGYLSLSLITALSQQLWRIESLTNALLYGVEACRFPAPVAAGASIRLRQRLVETSSAAPHAVKAVFASTIEIAGTAKPACVARTISMLFEEPA